MKSTIYKYINIVKIPEEEKRERSEDKGKAKAEQITNRWVTIDCLVVDWLVKHDMASVSSKESEFRS